MGELFLNHKDFFFWIAFLSELSWRNSFAMKQGGKWCGMRYEMRGARCEMRVFLSQSSLRWGEMIAFLSTLRNIGNCKVVMLWCCDVVMLKYFALWRDSSLRCASFRMTRLYILLMIRNLFQWENCFWIAKIFFLNCFFKWAKLAKFIRCEAAGKLMWLWGDEVMRWWKSRIKIWEIGVPTEW